MTLSLYCESLIFLHCERHWSSGDIAFSGISLRRFLRSPDVHLHGTMVDARAVSAPPSPPPIVEMRVRRSNKMKISKNENHYFYLLSAPRQPGGEAESAPRPAAAAVWYSGSSVLVRSSHTCKFKNHPAGTPLLRLGPRIRKGPG